MPSTAITPEAYIAELPLDKKEGFIKLRETIKKSIPKGFEEMMTYGMIGYVVPLSTYPAGYHCNSKLPLCFVNIACQKNFIAMHHMGLYGNQTLTDWFVAQYPKHSTSKLDMGKACIRLKKPDQIPFDLIAELMKKMTVNDWIAYYESALKRV